jgi:hypothetical protein
LVGYKPRETIDCTQSGVLKNSEFVTFGLGCIGSPYRIGLSYDWSQISFVDESFVRKRKGTVMGNYWVEEVSGRFEVFGNVVDVFRKC